MLYIDTPSCWFIFVNDGKFITLEVPRNISDDLFDFNWTDFNWIVSSEQISDLDYCWVMILFQKLSHDNCNPITSFTYNNITLLNMFGPGSPFSFNFSFDIVNENFGSSHWVGIVIDFITKADNWFVILKPRYFLNVIGFDVWRFLIRKFKLLFKVFNRVQIVEKYFVNWGDSEQGWFVIELEGFKSLTQIASVRF